MVHRLFSKLRGAEVGEQVGASLALAEVLLKMDKARALLNILLLYG